MRQKSIIYLIIYIAAVLLSSCTESRRTYRIAVSQCSVGNWRYKLNNEMLAAQYLFDEDVSLDIVNCYDRSDVQVRQIDSLLTTDVDLLVVAPNEVEEVAPALRRAKEQGVPVILFDRKAGTDDYTAFIGGDNVAVGQQAAQYAVQIAARTANSEVVEIAALQSTSPSRDRHRGFASVMQQHPEVAYRCIFGDWDDHHTEQIVKKMLQEGSSPAPLTIVFCHSDFMASGAWRAVKAAKRDSTVKIIGVDGLSGPGEGIEAVQQGHLIATCLYPTHGEQIVQLALDILTGRDYQRDNVLPSTIISRENVDMVALYADELAQQNADLMTIQSRLDRYFGLYNTQTKVIWASAAAIVLLLLAVVLTWRSVVQIRRAHHRQKAMNREQTQFYNNASHQLKTPLTLIAGPVKQLLDGEANLASGDGRELLEIVDRNVRQLEALVSDVLNFRKGVSVTVCDQTAADNRLQEEHLNQMKQEDSEELPNVLVIDDNDDMRRYLRTLLGSRYYVMEAANGQQGLKLARESVPDLIVSDVMMPVMDGLQLCRQLKEDFITSHIPVILLTARDTEVQQKEGYEHGADAYLTKPFNADVLTSRISNLLKTRQQLRALYDSQQATNDKQVKLTTQDSIFMDQLKEAVKAHMSNPNLKMDDLGEVLGISRVQLYRKVKVLTGLSPVELLRQMRLERGRILLNSTTKTVQEITYEVGFGTPSYFSACYKKQYGKLPMEERAEYQKS